MNAKRALLATNMQCAAIPPGRITALASPDFRETE